MKLTRRDTLALGAAATGLALLSLPARAANGDMVDIDALMDPVGDLPDYVLGDEDAPVTIIEYASPTCPHCAAFHTNVLPGLKEKYIDTGDVKLIVRPFVRNLPDVAVFLVAYAAGEDRYHDVVGAYMETQPQWIQYFTQSPPDGRSPTEALMDVALEHGFTEESFREALTNQDMPSVLEEMRDQALDEFGLEGTPTFYINGKTLSGGNTLEQLSAEIDPLLG